MIGETISHYRVLSKLGEGGMGVVYQAEDLKLKRTVALKFLPAHATENRERFLREAEAAASLNHPSICTIHEVDEEHNFIAMEWIEGPSVKEKIDARPLPLEEALHIALQCCAGLQAAHEKGIVHRDIKPANLMVTAHGQVKIMDFGLAQIGGRTRLTKTGVSAGTPAYMSPEQVQGRAADRRSDLWAVGVLLFEMLTGRLPFGGESEQAAGFGIVHSQPEPVTALRSGVPVELDRIVAKALAKSPEERYQNAADLMVDLRGVPASRQTSSLRREAAPPNRRQRIYWAAAAAVLAMASFLVWRAFGPSPSIQSVVILPLRPLSQEASDSLLGLGIADALITRISQTGQMQVRPISAVRKFAREDADPIETAARLGADAVLAGSLQQSGDRIRVSLQLLRTSNGATLWARSFDVASGDVFTVQDEIARQVAAQLKLGFDAVQKRDFEKRPTGDARAFEFYSKALYHIGNRTREGETALAIELLKRAVELDPNYALAHAQLGYAYAIFGVFTKDDAEMVAAAARHLALAEKIDPRLPKIHEGRSVVLYSRFGNWNLREAILEARAAQRLDPNAGHIELGYYYWHIGLEELGAKHAEEAWRADPDSSYTRNNIPAYYYMSLLADEGAAAERRLFNRSPTVQYYLIKRMANEAAPLVEKERVPASAPPSSTSPAVRRRLEGRVHRAQVLLLQGKRDEAAAEIGAVEVEVEKAPRTQPFHHLSYGTAQVRARLGDAVRALHWLQITVDAGWPQYPMMERDRWLDPVRRDPEVAKFFAALKKTWEGNRQEFGGEDR